MSAHANVIQPHHVTVLSVGEVRADGQGHEYLECDTSLGKVAIWGSERSRWNIGVVQSEALPFEAVMFCTPGPAGDHAYWVPEETKLFFPAI